MEIVVLIECIQNPPLPKRGQVAGILRADKKETVTDNLMKLFI